MALPLFLLTLFLIYLRPFKIPLFISSTFCALLAFLTKVVDLEDILNVWNMVWDSTLALVGLILFTLSLKKFGFFDFLAHYIILFSTHKKTLRIKTWKFYLFVVLLASFLSSFFANDGAILILTPLILILFGTNSKLLIIFLLLVSFLSDFASNIFIFSNLTNIITANAYKLDFFEYLFIMALPQVFAIFTFTLLFFMLNRKNLNKELEFNLKNKSLPTLNTLLFCVFLIVLMLLGIMFSHPLGIPMSFFMLFISLLAIFYGAFKKTFKILPLLKEAPFSIVIFSFGLFVVVYGLYNNGLIDFLANLIANLQSYPLFIQTLLVGFSSAFGSSLINNLPMVMIGDLALKDSSQILVYAHLLGCNIGSKLTPIGSLATLLWLDGLKRNGVKIHLFTYLFFAFILTLPTLFFALYGLYLTF
ncbi:ArsB/NhaD family transporter [Helicobacter burdigaliensis]|uniref:ArsB/NhaD family transporter n=1 Tax=Helicobacter burdigaliensis TaxID=2315334 RepID=UPI000EF6EA38|nr:ArsB/NhaD family transporter [Helicobacter burdigaliensis]